MEFENTFTEVSEEVVDPQETVQENSEVDNEEVIESVADSHPVQSAEENSKFKEFRLKMEAAEKRAKDAEEKLSGYENNDLEFFNALKAAGYISSSNKEDALAELKASELGITIGEYRQREEALNARVNTMLENHPDVVAAREAQKKLRALEAEKVFNADFEKIKQEYPDCDAKSYKDLGETYFKVMSVNGMDPVTAYRICMEEKANNDKKIPPKFEKVNNHTPKEKEFYTSEEIDRLTDEDYKNPKVMQRVRESLRKMRG